MNQKIFMHTIFAALLAAFIAFALAYVAGNYFQPFRVIPEEKPFETPWIKAHGENHYTSYFRHVFHVDSTPRRAWIRIAARDGFEISINNDVVGRSLLWRPTRPFQTGLSEKGQAVNAAPALLRLNYPREYQWEGHREYRLPVYMDITPYIKRGSNLLAFRVESRKAPAMINFEGEVILWTGERIPIGSSDTTKAEAVPPRIGNLLWDHVNYPDGYWDHAEPHAAPRGSILSLLDDNIYATPFNAQWLRASKASRLDRITFTRTWDLRDKPEHAWVRILSNRSYELHINGRRVHSRTKGRGTLADGDWIINSSHILNHVEVPELLDPDEIGELTAGKHFMVSPTRKEDETVDKNQNPSIDNLRDPEGASVKALAIEREEDITTTGSARVFTPDYYKPEQRVPTTLARNRQMDAFDAFDVSGLLKAGENTITVRTLHPHTAFSLNWREQIAADAMVHYADGGTQTMHSDEFWFEERLNTEGIYTSVPATTYGQAMRKGLIMPRLFFQGYSYNQRDKLKSWGAIGFMVGIPLACMLIWRHRQLIPLTFSPPQNAIARMRSSIEARELLAETSVWLLPPATTLSATIITKYAWAEREEVLLFSDGTMWLFGLVMTLGVWGFSTWWIFSKRGHHEANPANTIQDHFKGVTTSTYWKWFIIWMIIFATALRAFHIDFQTIDDDEYASMQTIQGIIETGKPQLNDDIWYTRSPLFHYLNAAVGMLFGFNLWSMRLTAVFWGACTAYLTYRCGRDILRSPWTGLAAALLYSIHPFLIYTAHISRFYQQQQFFALLTIYFFCMGFAGTTQEFKYRISCLVAFLCAILSQELSLVMGFQLLLGYIIFARPAKAPREWKIIALAVCVIALVAVNIMIFQTKTLTHLEGVSPNVEATLHPNFTSPMNYFSVFLGYSRLHLPISILLLMGLPFAFYLLDKRVIAFYFMLFSGVVFVNILVTGNSLRYQYGLIPLLILLGMYGPKLLADRLENIIRDAGRNYNPTYLKPLVCTFLFASMVVSWSPWRISESYETKLLGDASGAFQYIRTHMRDGDKVAATEPHPHGILMETGEASFDIAFPLLYDFVYKNDDGDIVDRNAQAKLVSTVEDMVNIFSDNDRIWIAINREKFRSRGKNIRWEYPGARAELFLRKNCTLVYESYLWSVFLWDVDAGRYAHFRHNWAR